MSNGNLYDRVRGIRPSPLYKQHLQPSNPPPSATREQLALFSRVLARRSNQLNLLPLESLQAAYDELSEKNKPTSEELEELWTQLPQKRPGARRPGQSHSHSDQDPSIYVSLVTYLLVENFHKSIDTRIKSDVREESLRKVRHIFSCLDLAYLDFSETELQQQQQQKQQEEAAAQAAARAQAQAQVNSSEKPPASAGGANTTGNKAQLQRGDTEEAAEVRALVAEARKKAASAATATATGISAGAAASNAFQSRAAAAAITTAASFAQGATAAAATSASQTPTTGNLHLDKSKSNHDQHSKEAKAENMGSFLSRGGASRAGGTGADDAIEIIDDDDSVSPEKEKDKSGSGADSRSDNINGNKEKSPTLPQSQQASHQDDGKMPAAEKEGKSKDKDTSIPTTSTSAPNASKDPKETTEKGTKTIVPRTTKSHLQILSFIESKKEASRLAHSIQRRRDRLPSHHPYRKASMIRKQYMFSADTKNVNTGWTTSYSLHERPIVTLYWEVGLGHWNAKPSGYIEGPGLDNLAMRYAKWDPFWRVVKDLSLSRIGNAEVGHTTTPIIGFEQKGNGQPPRSACMINTNMNQYSHNANALTRAHRSGKYQQGDRRLLLRALPLVFPEKYKKYRSDTHLWPKGTFIQFYNGDNRHGSLKMEIRQRRQQAHDHSLWKSMCHYLDVTPHLNSNSRANIDMAICTMDDEPYNFQLAVCEYVSPEKLLQELMGDGPRSIVKLTPEEGRTLVKKNLEEKDTVCLDSDDEDNGGGKGNGLDLDRIYLTCSLLCSVSMKAIQIPVRGHQCKHMQCFDLANYVATHSTVHGGRWRCAVCDEFVAVQDLMVDGFIAEILDKVRDEVSSARDKVEIYRDGTWKFLDENKLRYQKKRPAASSSEQPEARRIKTNGNEGSNAAHTEVIDILDDD